MLVKCIEAQNFDSFQRRITGGACPDDPKEVTSDGRAPLHVAAADNAMKFVQALIHAGANVDIKSSSGSTPLHEAAANDATHAAQLLIDAGADVNASNAELLSVLDVACIADSPSLVRLVVGAGADVTGTATHCSPLFQAKNPEIYETLARAWPQDHPLRLHALSRAGLTDEVVDAVAAGADVNACCSNVPVLQATPIQAAAVGRHLDVVELLAEAGADVRAIAADSFGAWYQTSHEVRRFVARIWPQNDSVRPIVLARADLADDLAALLAAGLDVNARYDANRTLVHIAARADATAVLDLLIASGADVTLRMDRVFWNSTLDMTSTFETRAVIARAWPKDHPFLLHALVKADLTDEVADAAAAGADLNAPDEHGYSALHAAALENTLNSASALLKAGADPLSRDEKGDMPHAMAYTKEMRALLSTYMRKWRREKGVCTCI